MRARNAIGRRRQNAEGQRPEPPERHEVAGSFADDETLPELCAEIYRQRDADLAP